MLWRTLIYALASGCAFHTAWGQPPPLPSGTAVPQPNGNVIEMPRPKGKTSRLSGLTISVDARWTNSCGYRPVEVTIKSPKPVAGDRLITIQLHAGWNQNVSVEQEFVMPRGSTERYDNGFDADLPGPGQLRLVGPVGQRREG